MTDGQGGAFILETRALRKRFGGIVVAEDLDLRCRRGELRCLIGPNGAGKTTFFNLVTGLLKPDAGHIFFKGRDVVRLPPHRIARLGITRSFQIPSLFFRLSVRENVRVAAQRHRETVNVFASPDRLDGVTEKTAEILEGVGLEDLASTPAHSLSHGEKKRLELAVALAGSPELLLLDEPTAGMNSRETREMAELVRRLAGDLSLIVIEHDMEFVREIADSITVLHHGRILAEGLPEEIERNPEVQEVYLGGV
jgi:urea ABC transporter ATP-binding protein UrtD